MLHFGSDAVSEQTEARVLSGTGQHKKCVRCQAGVISCSGVAAYKMQKRLDTTKSVDTTIAPLEYLCGDVVRKYLQKKLHIYGMLNNIHM